MGCQSTTKGHIRCPPGYHWNKDRNQCLDAQGNPPPEGTVESGQVANPPSESVVPKKERFSEGWDEVEFAKPKLEIPPEKKAKIDANLKRVKAYLRALGRTKKFGPALVPLTASLISYDICSKKSAEYRMKAKTEKQKKFVEEYDKQLEKLYSRIPRAKVDESFNPQEFAKKRARVDNAIYKEMMELKKLAQEKGKGSPEHARFKAYTDFYKNTRAVQPKIERRLNRPRQDVSQARERFKPNQ